MASRKSAEGHTIWLEISSLQYDERVQRPVNKGRVAKIAAAFDPDALGVIQVSERADGSRFVIDGWHRVMALKHIGWDNGQKVECKVRRGLTLAEEAQLFVELNNTAKPRYIDAFLVRVEAGDPDAVAVHQIIRAAGLAVDRSARDGHVCAVQALERIYRGDGRVSKSRNSAAVRDTLKVCTRSWGQASASLNGAILEGIGRVLLRYGSAVSIDDLVRKLGPFPGGAPGLLGAARATRDIRGGALANAVAGVVVDTHNKGRRSGKLPDWWTA